MRVPSEVPPGSRVVTTSRPCRRRWLASIRICVDFPHPSMPSKVIKAEVKTFRFSVPVGLKAGLQSSPRFAGSEPESGPCSAACEARCSPAARRAC